MALTTTRPGCAARVQEEEPRSSVATAGVVNRSKRQEQS
jgi:hypothetical protein